MAPPRRSAALLLAAALLTPPSPHGLRIAVVFSFYTDKTLGFLGANGRPDPSRLLPCARATTYGCERRDAALLALIVLGGFAARRDEALGGALGVGGGWRALERARGS